MGKYAVYALVAYSVVLTNDVTIQRQTKPTSLLPWHPVDSVMVVDRIRKVIAEIATPSWLDNVPRLFGDPQEGTLKASQWRILFSVHIPIALLSLWVIGLPTTALNAVDNQELLSCVMNLTCLGIIVGRRNLDQNHARLYLECLQRHMQGLSTLFPGFALPSHHLAFHIYDDFQQFGSSTNWWTFPYERMIGQLQHTKHNHKHGESVNSSSSRLPA